MAILAAPSLRARYVVPVVVAALLASACGLVPTRSEIRLPTWCATEVCPGVPTVVPRSGVIGVSDACIWLELDGIRGMALWPPGFRAAGDAKTITDDEGNTFGRVGNEVVAVVLGPKDATPSESCGLGVVFEVYVESVAAHPTARSPRGAIPEASIPFQPRITLHRVASARRRARLAVPPAAM